MATCTDCNQEMLTAATCSVGALHRLGVPVPQIHYGLEPRDASWGPSPPRCGDCGVRLGGFHHLGCDLARCPVCRRQLISCDCRFDEFAGEYDDEFDDELDDEEEPADPEAVR